MSTIDRVRYYDGEFLRAFDFSDEQTYHMEMRRRLNRDLHLYGIVQGLQLNDDNQAGVHQVSISPGMAIDALGREIYVFAPYTLGDSDLTNNRISKPENYDVWLRYSKTPATPPSAGYGVCNQPNQYTRWVESFTVVLLTSPSNPFTLPTFTDDDTDNPGQDGVGVLLGRVYIEPSSGTKQFSKPFFDDRLSFVGIVAQRIQSPYDATQSFNFQTKNSALSPLTSLDIVPNIFAQQNLILGQDFDLKTTPQTTVPALKKSGNAKIAGDLFVQGNVYSSIKDASGNPQWLGLAAYVQQLVPQFVPEIVTGVLPTVTIPNNYPVNLGAITASSTQTVQTQRLKSVTSALALAYISQVETADRATFDAQFKAGTQLQLHINFAQATAFNGSNSGSLSVNWTVGPATGNAATPFNAVCAIDNFTISFIVVCFP